MKTKQPSTRLLALLAESGAMVCGACLTEADDPKLKTPCTDTPKGNHRFTQKKIWMVVGLLPSFDVRSEQTILHCYTEASPDVHSLIFGRVLTESEIRFLQYGKCNIKVSIDPLPRGLSVG